MALILFISPVYISSQWQTYYTQTNANYYDVSVASSNVVWAVSEYPEGIIVKTVNGGQSWLNVRGNLSASVEFYHIYALDSSTAWVACGHYCDSLFKTTNGGQNWVQQIYPKPYWINKIHFFNASTGIMFVDHLIPANTDTCGYLITRNGGSDWYRSPNAPLIGAFDDNRIDIVDTSLITFLAVIHYPGIKSFFKLQGSLEAPWVISGLPTSYPDFAFFKDQNTGLATGGTDSIYRTTNAGLSWQRIAGGGFTYYDGFRVPGTDWALFYGGFRVMLTNNFGNSFQQYAAIGDGVKYGDAKDTNSIWLAGNGGKLYKYNINFIGIHQASSEVPQNFILHQNYPNPFNPATKIEFELPQSSDIEFAVYDAAGKQVYEITEQNIKPGKYGIDFNGSRLASGVYFYKLAAGNFNTTKRMVLVK